jgi:hypothetical protein
VYIASAEGDLWADPLGVFKALQAADPVYRFLGAGGFDAPPEPSIEKPVMSIMGHHIRKGGHDVKKYDWEQYISFAKKYL